MHKLIINSLLEEDDFSEDKTNPGIPSVKMQENSKYSVNVTAEMIAKRAFYIWRNTGCNDTVKNWYEAEAQLIAEEKLKSLDIG